MLTLKFRVTIIPSALAVPWLSTEEREMERNNTSIKKTSWFNSWTQAHFRVAWNSLGSGALFEIRFVKDAYGHDCWLRFEVENSCDGDDGLLLGMYIT